MSTMDTLIRVRKFDLDEKRRALKDLETVEAQHHTALKNLGEELIHEQKVATASQEGACCISSPLTKSSLDEVGMV